MGKFLYLFFLISAFIFTGCFENKQTNQSQKPNVVVSTFAIYDVAKYLAKDEIDVFLLLPPGREVHSFEPTPKDIIKLKKASLFVYNGAGLEPWVEKFATKESLDLSKYVTLIDFKNHNHHNHHHHHFSKDPHYWLDFANMKKVADILAKRFSKIVPKKKELFQKRAKEYEKVMDNLDKAYKNELLNCKKSEIFVNHNAYSYLGKKYNFGVHSLVGLSSEAKPSPKTIEEIINEIKKEDIKVIFFENFENSSVIKQIAKDTNVKVDTLQPLANITKDEAQKKLTYKDIMLKNLKKIKSALECK
jgi:zinc transport system substrate-binding protein